MPLQVIKTLVLIGSFFLVWLLSNVYGAGLGPTETVNNTIEKARAIVQNPAFRGEENKKARREALRKTIFPVFDFVEFSRFSLGKYWREITPRQRREFTELFKELLAHTYLSQVESLGDEKFVYGKEIVDGGYAEVRSKALTFKGELKINYKLLLKEGEWAVYDLVVEDVSIANNYRAQFARKLAGITFDELLQAMRKQVKEIQGRYD